MFKMLYLIGPDGLVNWGFVNLKKMVWKLKFELFVSSDNGTS